MRQEGHPARPPPPQCRGLTSRKPPAQGAKSPPHRDSTQQADGPRDRAALKPPAPGKLENSKKSGEWTKKFTEKFRY